MSLPTARSQEIANAFARYARIGDRSFIDQYGLEEIEVALMQYSADKDFPHYSAMKKIIDELKGAKKERKSNRERWKDRIIGFLSGIAITIIGGIILYYLTK